MKRFKKVGFKKIKTLALFVLALGFSLMSWGQVAIPEASAFVFTKHTIDGAFDAAQNAYPIDIDNDGDVDVLGAAGGDDEIAWWENDGNENFTKHVIADLHCVLKAYPIDIDNDGDIDVLGAASTYDAIPGNGERIVWWENDGNENFIEHIITLNYDARDVYPIDIDNDGDIDVLGSRGGAAHWWENDGNENFTEYIIDGSFVGAGSVQAIDIDNDGDIDVLGSRFESPIISEIIWWENDGNENFTRHSITMNLNGARDAYATDLDNDGDIDVLGAAQLSNEISWWENDGSENFTKHTIDGGFSGAWGVHATDLDNDGDLDVLGAAADGHDVAWWENDGNENFAKHLIDGNFVRAYSAYAADIDGDGDLDILGAAGTADEIAWWESSVDVTPPAIDYLEAEDSVGDLISDGPDGIAGNADDNTVYNSMTGNVVIESISSDNSGVIANHKIHFTEDNWTTTSTRDCGANFNCSIDICTVYACPLSVGTVIKYKSEATDNDANTVSSAEKSFVVINALPRAIGCSSSYDDCTKPFEVKVSWSFDDPGDTQSAYQVQIASSADFVADLMHDSGKVMSASEWFTIPPEVVFPCHSHIYHWRVRVWDSHDATCIGPWCRFCNGLWHTNFPTPDFSYLPAAPEENQVVNFTDLSSACGATTIDKWEWDFGDGTPIVTINAPAIGDTTHTYVSDADYTVKLTVTNDVGFSCSYEEVITVDPSVAMDTWAKTYGEGGAETIRDIQQTFDGGYITVGYTNSYGGPLGIKLFVTRLDSSGTQVWTKTYNDTTAGEDINWRIRQTDDNGNGDADDGYVIITTMPTLAGPKTLVLKLDPDGSEEWAKEMGGGFIGVRYGHDIDQTFDGGYIITGYDAMLHATISKLDFLGNEIWTKSYDMVRSYSVRQTFDGGYIMGGVNFGVFYLLKLDSSGDRVWMKAVEGGNLESVWSTPILQTFDGGYVTSLITKDYGAGSDDALIIKFDPLGNQVWAKTFGGVNREGSISGGAGPNPFAIYQTADDGYVIAGKTESYGFGETDILIIKLDSLGIQEWARTFGDAGYDVASAVQQTSDGGYVVSGRTTSFGAGSYDSLILKLDSNGDIESCSPPLDDPGLILTFDVAEHSADIVKDPTGINPPVVNPVIIVVDVTPTVTNACVACDIVFPTLTTEAYIPDIGTGTEIIDGGIINLGDIDEAGEEFTLYSNATDPVPASGIQDQKIKWWHYDDAGTLKNNGTEFWDMTTVPVAGGLNSLTLDHTLGFADGDRIEYMSEATDIGGPNTTYDPVDSEGCGNAPCGDRYSFTIEEAKTWAKTYGGTDNDSAFSVQQTADGGYITTGYTRSYGSGNADFLITKVDSSGVQEWTRTCGDFNMEAAYSIKQTSDGEYIVAGWTDSYGGSRDILVSKVGSAGNQKWSRTFGSAGLDFLSWDLVGNSFIQQTDDDGYIITGLTTGLGVGGIERILVVKINADVAGDFGGVAWAKTFGSAIRTISQSIQQTSDGGYIIAGWDTSIALGDAILLLKLDSSGNQQWVKLLSGAGISRGSSIQQTNDDADGQKDDGYIITSWGGIIKINADVAGNFGGVNWGKKFDCVARSIKQTSDDEYVIVGYTGAYGFGGTDVLVIKIDPSGIQQWARTFGSTGDETARSIQQTSDGGYIMAGDTDFYGVGNNDLLVLKMDENGDIESCSPPLDDPGAIAVANVAPVVSNVALTATDVIGTLVITDVFLFYRSPGLAEINACCDSIPPTVIAEAHIPDNGGTLINDDGTINLSEIDEAGEEFTLYSNATDPIPASGIQNQKIKWWHYDNTGTLKNNGVEAWDTTTVPVAGGLNSLALDHTLGFVDGDRIEYMSEATDVALNPTTYDPVNSEICGNAPCGDRYSFMVVKAKTWAKAYGDTAFDTVYSVEQTSDGGYVTVGYTYSYGAGNADLLVTKVDSSGIHEWTEVFGEASNELAYSVKQTSDDGYIIAGWTDSYSGSSDILVIKLDSAGNKKWSRTLGSAGLDFLSWDLVGNSFIQQTDDDGYVITGTTVGLGAGGTHRLLVIKINADVAGNFGGVVWAKTFGSIDTTVSQSIQQTFDGGYIIAGWDSSIALGDAIFLLRLDSSGDQQWVKLLSGAGIMRGSSIQQTNDDADGQKDDGYIITSWGGIIKINADVAGNFGGIDWGKRFNCIARSIKQTSDDEYVIAGYTSAYGFGGTDALIIKIDSSGIQQWARTFGSTGDETARSIQQTFDGGYIVAGDTDFYGAGNEDLLVLKLDRNGDIESCSPPLDDPGAIAVANVAPVVSNVVLTATDVIGTLVVADVVLINDSPTPTETNACTGCDATPPTFVTEAKDENGVLIADGGMVNVNDTDTVTIESDAQDASGVVDNQKIKYWINGVLHIPIYERDFPFAGGLHTVTIPGPLNIDDVVEYQIEATDDDLNTSFDPADGVTRYSFTVIETKTWARAYGGADYEETRDIQRVADGGYISIGMTRSYGGAFGEKIIITKLNSSGVRIWAKTYDGFAGSSEDDSFRIRQTDDDGDGDKDDGYVAIMSVHGMWRSYVLVLKLDHLGNEVWAKKMGGVGVEWGRDIQQTNDRGYILAGYDDCGGGSFVSRLDSFGNELWTKHFNMWRLYTVQQTFDGGYIVGSSLGDGFHLLKLDSSGNRVWMKGVELGTLCAACDIWSTSILQTSDGGYATALVTNTYGAGDKDVLVIKFDSLGNQVWAKTFGGTESEISDSGSVGSNPFAIYQTVDDGYIIAGGTKSYGFGGTDVLIIKLTSLGIQEWARTFGDADEDIASAVQQTFDGGYIVSGKTTSLGAGGYDSLILKLDSNGDIAGCPPLNNPGLIPTFDVAEHSVDLFEDPADIDPPVNDYNTIVVDVAPIVTNACAACNTAPTIPSTSLTDPSDWCKSSPGATLFSWAFDDAEDGAGNQTAYQIDLTRSDGGTCSSGKQVDNTTSFKAVDIPGCGGFVKYGGHTYDWDVTVWDSAGASTTASGASFVITPLHQWPTVCMTYLPANPAQFDAVIFDPSCSMTYVGNPLGNAVDGSTHLAWDWDYDDTDPTEPSEDQIFSGLATYPPAPPAPPEVSHSFVEDENYTVDLKVTDSVGYFCWASDQDAEEVVPIDEGMPAWNEITP